MADLNVPGLTDEVPAFARPAAAVRVAAACYVRRVCPDADLILAVLDLGES